MGGHYQTQVDEWIRNGSRSVSSPHQPNPILAASSSLHEKIE